MTFCPRFRNSLKNKAIVLECPINFISILEAKKTLVSWAVTRLVGCGKHHPAGLKPVTASDIPHGYRSNIHSSIASFKSALKTHLFPSGLWCLTCVRAAVCQCVRVWSDEKDVECNVVYVISRVNCALGCAYILLTLLCLYCALQAH